MAERGVEGQAIPAAQAERLLARQLRQLPRWLRQTRYNGPPPLRTPRASIATAASFSNNPALAADGGRVVWEAYQARLAVAKRRGEIGVQAARPALPAAPLQVQLPPAMSPAGAPHSDYNPALSADGRYVAFESAQGNLNFAKRYGRMAIFVSDLETGVSAPAGGRDERVGGALVRSAYNPTISGDGRLVAFEAAGTGPGGLGVVVRDRATGRSQRIASPPGAGELSEPDLSPDGRAIAFTALGRFGGTAISRVWVRDLASGAVRPASPARAEAYEADLSRDGRRVAMTVRSGPATTRVVVRDLRTGRERVVAPGAGDGLPDGASASEPSVSHDGRRVAFVVRNVGDRDSRVFVRDLAAGTTRLVSRASGSAGAPADGASEHPAISGDGRRVAFASDAWNLSPAKCNSARGVFVRDLRRSTTTLVSRGDGDGRRAGPTRGSSTGADALVSMLCA